MELTDSTRSPLGIDLNEIPTTSSTETLADSSQERPEPASAASVGEDRDGMCAACGAPEDDEDVMVCDGCERGFHLECAGMRGRQAVNFVEWVCADCVENGVKSKRWPLGKKKRILDINASPPSDADGDATEEALDVRKHNPGDNSFGGNAFVAPVTYSSFLYAGNGFGSQEVSEIMTHSIKTGFEDIFLRAQRKDGSFKEVDLGVPLGRHRSSYRFPSKNPSEILLQALKEFISERHGILEEGWHVELRPSMNSCGPYAVYCAPDGKTFDSVFEVACYLGLMSNFNSVDAEIRTEGSPVQEKMHLPRKRKLTKSSIVNGFADEKDLISDSTHEVSSGCQHMDSFSQKSNSTVYDTEAAGVENGFTGLFQQNIDGFPVQFEEFFVLSLGHVDARPSYHNVSLICPVGYTSCWHDKITGSLFICEVSDGGDSGPVFKVRRCSCSLLPIPNGSTVLLRTNHGQSSGLYNEGNGDIATYGKDDNDISIQIILSDPCPPKENDILTCLGNSANETCNAYTVDNLVLDATSVHEKSGRFQYDRMGLRDEIDEIYVEDHSSSSAWRLMSQKFVDACTEICKRKGTLKFFCRHIENRSRSANWDMMDEKNKARFASLQKFFGSPASISIPSEFRGDKEFDTLTDAISKWLNQDRFGLDTEFVQEIIEKLPGVKACSSYEFLKDRSSYSESPTVGNGLMMAKMKGVAENKNEEVSDGSFGRPNKCRMVEDCDHCPPPGKVLCSRLPSQIVGDFYQVWELFVRFHEILGLKKPFSLDELEEELTNPWSDGSSPLEKFEQKIQGTEMLSSQRSDVMGEQMLSSSPESNLAVPMENIHEFIPMETVAMKEMTQAKLSSGNCSRYSAVVLASAHISLLGVVISELQSKVAALVDPNFDFGESKSKRGRKKDADSSIPPKRGKLNMLPLNELTWPELARRYILAVLSMDGVLDSAEITARESGKVFRCLQGDGGVLCGSLTGVAGMEADALLLAEATKKVFSSLNRENDMLTIEEEGSDASDSSEKKIVNDVAIPDWAQVLEPVRKLPTNVGTRIRKCVYEALEKGPPDWAKKRLEHSISKEVYKGNASGPTKKAVISVLADVQREGLPQKSEKETKKKAVISISDIIMKQCRIVLRHAAAADDAKIFCNLLGRKLMGSTDNDDEGLLGSPGMVSRPLDFRTIDLRLAVGAYNGSHEAFLEDVRELWNNVGMAYGDQPDFVELAEKLSENFEVLYEKEVVSLVEKLVGYAKLECLGAETKKEINDILAFTSEVPKAPWDEGVCKVCGVDKDDDSVLLCDTCDAEYHTYCLDPPLARIPEGNWYCPSCVVSNRILQDASEHSQVKGWCRGKKYQGEVTHVYLQTLRHLTVVMEEKDYWEFNVNEKIFLLRYLCDELLNTALIRQHLEHCAETIAELQQKLRSFSLEWKNLKSKEETVAAKAPKVDSSMLNAVGSIGAKEVPATTIRNNGKNAGQPHTSGSRNNCFIVFSDDVPPTEVSQEESGLNDSDRHPSLLYSEKNYNKFMKAADTDGQIKDPQAVIDNSSQKNDKSRKLNDLPLSNSSQVEINDPSGEIHLQDNLQDLSREIATLPPPIDHEGLSAPSEMTSLNVTQDLSSVAKNESQGRNLELNTIKNDMVLLQDLITATELQLQKLSLRREFLGSDSVGQLYWISAVPGMHPRVIVDRSFMLQQRRKMIDSRVQIRKDSILQNSTSSGSDTCSNSEGSKACCPFLYDPNVAMAVSPQWVFYQTDVEVEELIRWLKDNDPKERELKESIMHWQKQRFQESHQTKNQVQDDNQSLQTPNNSEKHVLIDCLVTKAATYLEKKYGPCFEFERTEIMKKRGKKARVTSEEKMYRCDCLESIWPSRNHCLSCHRTFLTDVEFMKHNDDSCYSAQRANERSKEISGSLKGKGHIKSDTAREAYSAKMGVETSKSRCSDITARLIKFRNEELLCPYDLEEISSKFMTKDSNKELIQEIGLIGSKGIPSLIPSESPFLSDPSLMLISLQKEGGIQGDDLSAVKGLLSSQENRCLANAGNDDMADNSSRQSTATGIHEVMKSNKLALGCSKQRDRRSSLDRHSLEVGASHCCVVPQSSLRPLIGKVSHITRRLKIDLLDMDAALPEAALRPSKAHLERRWAWRAFVKSAETIYEMVQATIVLEDMIKTEYLRNEWWYWSSLSAAAKTSTISSLALRIYSLDAAIFYEKSSNLDSIDNLKLGSTPEHKPVPSLEVAEKLKVSRKSNKKRKEPDG